MSKKVISNRHKLIRLKRFVNLFPIMLLKLKLKLLAIIVGM